MTVEQRLEQCEALTAEMQILFRKFSTSLIDLKTALDAEPTPDKPVVEKVPEPVGEVTKPEPSGKSGQIIVQQDVEFAIKQAMTVSKQRGDFKTRSDFKGSEKPVRLLLQDYINITQRCEAYIKGVEA